MKNSPAATGYLWFFCVTSSPLYAQSNGKAEKGVHIVKQLLEKAHDCNSDPYWAWLSYLALLLEHGKSPAELLMGSRLRSLHCSIKEAQAGETETDRYSKETKSNLWQVLKESSATGQTWHCENERFQHLEHERYCSGGNRSKILHHQNRGHWKQVKTSEGILTLGNSRGVSIKKSMAEEVTPVSGKENSLTGQKHHFKKSQMQ